MSSDQLCAGPECSRPAATRGLCHSHYSQQVRGKDLTPITRTSRRRPMLAKLIDGSVIDEKTGCWNWISTLTPEGYGAVSWSTEEFRQMTNWPYKTRRMLAHRAAWHMFVAPLPPEAVVHHTCANRRCINPAHLQPLTHLQNVAESHERAAYRRRIQQLEQQAAACTCQQAVAA